MSASPTSMAVGLAAPLTQNTTQGSFPPALPSANALPEVLDEKLKEGFRYIFEANRLAGELKEQERKVDNYKMFRENLKNDDRNSTEVSKLDKSLADRTHKLKKVKESLHTAEQQAIKSFKEFLARASDTAAENAKELQKNLEQKLQTHAETLSSLQKSDNQLIRSDINTLQTQKMSKDERHELLGKLTQFKTEILDMQEKNTSNLRLQNKDTFVQLQSQVDDMSKSAHRNIIDRVTAHVMNQVTEEYKLNNLKDLHKTVTELQQTVVEQTLREHQADADYRGREQRALPQKLTEFVRSQIENYLGSSRIQQMVDEFPEMKNLKRIAEQVESQAGMTLDHTTTTASGESDATKHELEIQKLQEHLAEQSALLDETRTLLDAFRSHGIRLSQENVDESRMAAAIKQIDGLSRKIHLVRNNLSSVETKFDLQLQELHLKLEDNATTEGTSRKRKRTESHEQRDDEDSEEDNDTTNSKLDLAERRLVAKEEVLQQLIDYIHQFRNTILNPAFPDNLESGIRQLEKILRNHEAVIAYMIDPVAAAAGQMQHHDRSTESTSLSPPMLDAINDLVIKSTEKAIEPFVEKIRILEKELEATRNNRINETR